MISRMVSRSGLVVLHLDVAKAAALLDHSTLVCIVQMFKKSYYCRILVLSPCSHKPPAEAQFDANAVVMKVSATNRGR